MFILNFQNCNLNNQFRLKTESACKAKLIGTKNEDGTYVYQTKGAAHTHLIDARDKEVMDRMKKAKATAKTDTAKTTRELYSEALAGASDEVIAQMPSSSTFAKNMRNQRINGHSKAPQSLKELELLPISTKADEPFVMYDNGKDAKHRLIMFSTKASMDFMATCPILHMDGTVSSGPTLFDQIYVIHGEYSVLIGESGVNRD